MNIFVFGEILWDVYDSGRVIGGAPFNFSAHLAALGMKSYLVSAVGSDMLGKETLENITEKNVESDYVKVIDNPTGVCNVTLNEDKIPTYTLVEGVAYDNITVTEDDIGKINNVKSKSLYLGTLAMRNAVSRATAERLVQSCKWDNIFFDVNIRQHFYSKEIIDFGLKACTILKFSREEADVFARVGLTEYDGTQENLENLCRELSDKYDIAYVLLTLDKDGAAVYDKQADSFTLSQKPQCKVVSTVGAGDSFFASYVRAYLNDKPVVKCLADAIAVSGYVVGHVEAIPAYSEELINKLG